VRPCLKKSKRKKKFATPNVGKEKSTQEYPCSAGGKIDGTAILECTVPFNHIKYMHL
jgi:hypothetical protein